jgi:hypothetical protein
LGVGVGWRRRWGSPPCEALYALAADHGCGCWTE